LNPGGAIYSACLLRENERNNAMRSSKPIMLIEDDAADVLIIKRALKDLQIKNKLIQLNNGEEALEYLTNQSNPAPCIIFLDLNMPKMNGIEFLKIIKDDDKLKLIPIVALTTSQNIDDIAACFKSGIAGYIIKPVDYKKFVKAVRIVDLYWMLSHMPSESPIETNLESINLDKFDEEIFFNQN
jgi:CheY-like chemotaxis protein